jgi:polyhydroxybutyrate depolymerase
MMGLRGATRLAGVLALFALSGCATWGMARRAVRTTEPGTAQVELRVGGEMRTYLLHVPPHAPRRFVRSASYPLVIVLHGSGASGQTVRQMSRLDSLADLRDFVTVYPDATRNWLGLQSSWNAGACCGAAVKNDVDDLGFLRALVTDVAGVMPIDRRRVYVAGFSDGARMAYRAGCEMSDEVAAIGVVAGSLAQRGCAPGRAVPLIAFHGTADEEVPFADRSFTASHGSNIPVPAPVPPSVRFWAVENGCRDASLKRLSPAVSEVRFGRCRADVELLTIEGGGHGWPGGEQDGDDGDTPTRELSASVELVRFFLRHPLR